MRVHRTCGEPDEIKKIPNRNALPPFFVLTVGVLITKFAAGLFDQPYTDPALLLGIDSDAHRRLARDAVTDGATLLQNKGGVLPRHPSSLKKVWNSPSREPVRQCPIALYYPRSPCKKGVP